MLVKFFLTNILRANITLFVMTNLKELIKTHKIEIYGDIAYAVFTLNEIFCYKGNQNKDLSTYTCIF